MLIPLAYAGPTITGGGRSIPTGSIVNADVNASAGIELNKLGNPTSSPSFSFGAWTLTHASTTDGWGGVTLYTNVADNASDTTLLTLKADDADDVNTIFFTVIEDADGSPAVLWKMSQRTFTIGTNAYIGGIKEYQIQVGADVMGDDEYNGITLEGKNAGSNVSQWNPVFLASDGKYDEADAGNALFPAVGLAVECDDETWDCNDTDGLTILKTGVVRNEGWAGLTVGGGVFLSDDPTTTTGITQTEPTGDNYGQKIGVALSDSEILFNFRDDKDNQGWIEYSGSTNYNNTIDGSITATISYKAVGGICYVHYYIVGDKNVTANKITFTLPFANNSTVTMVSVGARISDAGTFNANPGMTHMATSSATVSVFYTAEGSGGAGTWTDDAAVIVQGQFFYEIN